MITYSSHLINNAPVITAGDEYWITVKAPLGVLYAGGAHNTGFTAGHSYYEGSTDTTVWNPLILTTERDMDYAFC